MASAAIVDVTPDNFEESVLGAGVPVLVDFWAPWCGPCLAVGPVLDQLAADLEGRVRIVKLNIDEHEDLAFRYQVASIPTFILFKDGKVADRTIGTMPKAAFRDFIDRNL